MNSLGWALRFGKQLAPAEKIFPLPLKIVTDNTTTTKEAWLLIYHILYANSIATTCFVHRKSTCSNLLPFILVLLQKTGGTENQHTTTYRVIIIKYVARFISLRITKSTTTKSSAYLNRIRRKTSITGWINCDTCQYFWFIIIYVTVPYDIIFTPSFFMLTVQSVGICFCNWLWRNLKDVLEHKQNTKLNKFVLRKYDILKIITHYYFSVHPWAVREPDLITFQADLAFQPLFFPGEHNKFPSVLKIEHCRLSLSLALDTHKPQRLIWSPSPMWYSPVSLCFQPHSSSSCHTLRRHIQRRQIQHNF